jgi:hydrogenase nickel incorporation protein HypA/HybF
MHEMGIALQIVEITTTSLPADLGAARVAAVNLKIGKLAAVVPESLRFCFDVVVASCNDCNARWTIDEPVFICKTCQSGSLEILSGRELDIESIEVVEEEK